MKKIFFTTIILVVSYLSYSQNSINYSKVFNESGKVLEGTSCFLTFSVDELSKLTTYKFQIITKGARTLNEVILVQLNEPSVYYKEAEVGVFYFCSNLEGRKIIVDFRNNNCVLRVFPEGKSQFSDTFVWLVFTDGK
jgi:hypothetical protein